jgi:hypothetical protein
MYKPGDLVFTQNSGVISRIIRWLTRSRGESPTYASHVEVVVNGHYVVRSFLVRARVESIKWGCAREVWRHRGLSDGERVRVAAKAMDYVGRRYDYAKLLLHGLDALLGKVRGRDVFFFRTLGGFGRYVICSWVCAFAYSRALDYTFGIPPEFATPDDMHDWVVESDEWELVEKVG